MKSAAALLDLKNVKVINGRAEELAKGEMRESFDIVTARGVARMNTLAEYCLPFVKKEAYSWRSRRTRKKR